MILQATQVIIHSFHKKISITQTEQSGKVEEELISKGRKVQNKETRDSVKTLGLAVAGRQSHTLTLRVKEEQTHIYLRSCDNPGGKQKL